LERNVAKEKPSQAILGIDEAQKAVDEHFKIKCCY